MPKHHQKPGRPRNRAAGTPPPAGTNPVDDRKFTGPLIRALRDHVDAITESMTGPKASHATAERVRPAAVCWVYYSVLVAWAEDHHLIDPHLRADAKPRRQPYEHPHAGGIRGWLARAYASLAVHPATWCLLDPAYTQLRDHTPSEQACRDLADWWATEAPSLAYQAGKGPASITGWLVGDLLQALSDTRRKGHALAQTPWWVADGILDRTLLPAAAQHHGETLHMADPTCGTGHFLIRTIDYLYEWYTTGTLAPRQMHMPAVTGGPTYEPAEAIRRILAGVDGVELDPLTAAVARLRVTVTIGDLLHRAGLLPVLRLDTIPPIRPRIAVGDSLLAGKVSKAEYARIHPRLAAIQNLGHPDQPAAAAADPGQVALFNLTGGAV